jgi:hypothetical protein
VRQSPNYGVSARLEGGVIELILTFRTGSVYCCYESGCHLDLYDGKRWNRLRRELAIHGAPIPGQLELRLTLVIEDGALFFDLFQPEPSRRGRGWYAFAPKPAHQYEKIIVEGYGPDIVPDTAVGNRE